MLKKAMLFGFSAFFSTPPRAPDREHRKALDGRERLAHPRGVGGAWQAAGFDAYVDPSCVFRGFPFHAGKIEHNKGALVAA